MTIDFKLSKESIEQAVKKLEEYEQSIQNKNELLVKELCEETLPVIDSHMSSVYTFDDDLDTTHYDDIVYNGFGSYRQGTVSVTNKDITFIEFGAGVSLNDHYKSSPHPKGVEMGMTIGEYGLGRGSKEKWKYMDNSGVLHETYGTRAEMPLYNASMYIREKMYSIARNIFRS